MTKGTTVRLLAGVAMSGILFATTAVVAQPGRGGPHSPEQRIAQVEKGVREKVAPKLGLDERTTNRLVEIAQGQVARRHAAMQKVRLERQALKDLLDRKAPAAELETQLKKLEEAQATVPRPDAVLDETRRILTVEQQAQLTLLLPKFGGMHGRGGRHGGPPDGKGPPDDECPHDGMGPPPAKGATAK